MLNETKISCFLCVAETLNYTKAALLLHMTPQAVSKYIIDIEKQFGFRLFYRDNKHVELTKAGRQCYDLFTKYLDNYNNFLSENRQALNNSIHELRIGYLQFDFNHAIINAFKKTREFYPQLTISMESNTANILIQHLNDKTLDLIIVSTDFINPQADMHSAKLKLFPIYLMVSTAHPLMTEHATFKDFIHEPAIMNYQDNESPADAAVRADTLFSRIGLTPSKIIWVPNRETLYSSVEMGLGVALGGMSVHSSILSGSVCKLPTDSHSTMICIWYGEEREKNKQIKTYVKFLQQEYALL